MKSELFEQPSARFFIGLVLRVLLYAVLLGALALGMLWGAVEYGTAFYDEVGPVEILETVFALSAALLFLFAGRLDKKSEPFAVVVASFLFCLFIRESDYFLDVLICRHTWKFLVTLVLVFLAFYSMRHFREIVASLVEFVRHPSFGIFLSGLLVLIVFSRLFGYGGFWKELLDGETYRPVKTIVEEGVEQMGYFLLLISSSEYLHDTLVRRRQNCSCAR